MQNSLQSHKRSVRAILRNLEQYDLYVATSRMRFAPCTTNSSFGFLVSELPLQPALEGLLSLFLIRPRGGFAHGLQHVERRAGRDGIAWALVTPEQGGLLTDKVDQHPHCVLLLDEIEKAHPDIFNVLLQVMDHGTLTDNNGRKADFRNVIIVMTTNAGAETMNKATIGFTNPRQAGEAAKRAGAKKLVLTHYSGRDADGAMLEDVRRSGFEGEIVIAKDGDRYEIV